MWQDTLSAYEKLLNCFGIFNKMRIQGCLLIIISSLLSGCLSQVWTGANLVYDRHTVYLSIDDFQLNAQASRALYHDKVFKQEGCAIELAVFNRDILMVGHVPTRTLYQEAYSRLAAVPGKRRLFNQLTVNQTSENLAKDMWITTKIRSQIFANSDINPKAFKVLTCDGVVYLMGDVIPAQAAHVVLFARQSAGVKRVVKLFKYYNLSDEPK